MPDISERNFEEIIEALLLAGGLASPLQGEAAVREVSTADGNYVPGGFRNRLPADYDKSLCLLPQDLFDFLYVTQPKEWEKLKKSLSGDAFEVPANLAFQLKLKGPVDYCCSYG